MLGALTSYVNITTKARVYQQEMEEHHRQEEKIRALQEDINRHATKAVDASAIREEMMKELHEMEDLEEQARAAAQRRSEVRALPFQCRSGTAHCTKLATARGWLSHWASRSP